MSTAPGRRANGAPAIEILIESPLWKSCRGVRTVLRRAVTEAAAAASTRGGEVAIVLTDDSAIRVLNSNWRGKDKPTNVLSFPGTTPPAEGAPRHLGDIVIAYQTAAREAQAEDKPFAHHLAHLAVHGFLHLVGYDHEDDAEADAMEGLEVAVLARISVPNPYVALRRKR